MLGKRVVAYLGIIGAVGCASGGAVSSRNPAPAPVGNQRAVPIGWPVRTAEYVDLWLHGFALVSSDSAKVPLFEPGYRARMLAVRRDRNITTALDANQPALSDGLAKNAELTNAQFAIFGFASFDELVRVTQLFVQNDGSPLTQNDPTTKQLFVWMQNYFRTVADRQWLRLFVLSLQEEQTRFYNSYWTALQGDRAAVREAVSTAWTGTYREKFSRYLRNERLVDGTFILSLPLAGEGRTVTDQQMGNGIAVPFPATTDSALNAIYVFAHEITGTAADRGVSDNITPTERQNGVYARTLPIANVRAGAVLLSRIAPELVAGYERYYLLVSHSAIPSGDPEAAFIAAFDLPLAIRDGLTRQIDLVLAGI